MSKVLICSAGTDAEHKWDHPGGRGRPPKFCPEHRPADSTKSHGNPQRAKAANSTIQPERVNPFIAKANKAKIAPALAAKQQRRQEDAEQRERELEKEFELIDERETEAYARYEEAYNATVKKKPGTDEQKEWDKIGRLQQAAINVSARKRFLYDHFEKLTAKEQTTPEVKERVATVQSPTGAQRVEPTNSHADTERVEKQQVPEDSERITLWAPEPDELEIEDEDSSDEFDSFMALIEGEE